MTELSDTAKAICAKHYNFKSRSSCNACPLQPECHKPAATLTPGRGVFLRRGRTSEIQIALPSADEAAEPTPAA